MDVLASEYDAALDAVKLAQSRVARHGKVFCVVFWAGQYEVLTKSQALRKGYQILEQVRLAGG